MSNPTGKGGLQERKHQINRKGRPKSFDALRALAQQIAHEEATTKGGPIIVNGHVATNTEIILRQWAGSKNPKLQLAFIEIAYGKTPTITELSGKDGMALELVTRIVRRDADS